MTILRCNHLTYRYPEGESDALSDVTVQVRPGEFILLVGASGSGKSTFLRALNGLVPRFYGGTISGEVLVDGRPLDTLSQREIVTAIGFLHQDPERQLLLDTVERDLVFGMENIGLPHAVMRSRLAEISQLFGLGPLLRRKVDGLSGGEKQRVALASVLCLYPQVLLLDEPTSQLDPVHADEFLHVLRRLHEEWGMTVVMSEHRLERCFHLADRLLLFEQGRIAFDGTPRQFAAEALASKPEWMSYLPPVTRAMAGRVPHEQIPLTVKEARLCGLMLPEDECRVADKRQEGQEILSMHRARTGYEAGVDVLKDVTYAIYAGDHIALFGENGAGKSTWAKTLAGVLPLRAGEIRWMGRSADARFWQTSHAQIGYLAQNPNDYFLHDTVEEELLFSLRQAQSQRAESPSVEQLLALAGLEPYRSRHPHDLSGGEKQRLALAIVLAAQPQVLILDEPTRGLDPLQKQSLCSLLHRLPLQAVVVITHDVEFARDYANRVSILYDGEIVTDGSPDDVFRQSFAYAPQLYRIRQQHPPSI